MLIFDVPTCISFISQHVTLYWRCDLHWHHAKAWGPWTRAIRLKSEISHIGVLRNPVMREAE